MVRIAKISASRLLAVKYFFAKFPLSYFFYFKFLFRFSIFRHIQQNKEKRETDKRKMEKLTKTPNFPFHDLFLSFSLIRPPPGSGSISASTFLKGSKKRETECFLCIYQLSFPLSFSVLLSTFSSPINRLSKQRNKMVNVGYHYV